MRAAAAPTPGRPETIEEIAEMVSARGGTGIAARVDLTEEAAVRRDWRDAVARDQHLAESETPSFVGRAGGARPRAGRGGAAHRRRARARSSPPICAAAAFSRI